MVLLAAAICTKSGKALLSRQFVEMSKSRIEGLLSAFPKLMSGGKQHTFVETESVRYVYQPIEKLYMLLITTKASNILEDLETLRLFSRVIADYCVSLEESEIMEQSFTLIFAFDEIVALGYRESVNLAQIRTFVEMDSHEEKVYQAVRQTQEREARNKMREKAKELHRQRIEASKRGMRNPTYMGTANFMTAVPVGSGTPKDTSNSSEYNKSSSYNPVPGKPTAPSKALRLGTKARDVDSFVDQLKSEGEKVTSATPKITGAPAVKSAGPPVNTEPIHLHMEEKIIAVAGRDGGLRDSMEIHGIVTLRIEKEDMGRIVVHLNNQEISRGIQMQTHPNVDKELFKTKGVIGLKNPSKPFPLLTDVGVLKWRFQTNDESFLPITINCWPSENAQGGCDVNIEYELQDAEAEFRDVQINIPMPLNASPVVEECDGEYIWESRKGLLVWKLPLIDASNKTGTLEFTTSGTTPNDFFPVTVCFASRKPFVHLQITGVTSVDDEAPVKFSTDTLFYTEKYEIM